MSFAGFAHQKRTLTVFTTIVAMVAGVMAYFALGQLEDPEFTIKLAVVATPYPGASPEEVELEVTDVIERAVQELAELKEVESYSEPGLSTVRVIIKPSIRSPEIPQVWDSLRKKIADAESSLPPGARSPIVIDDFGDVFGFLFALQGDGYSHSELERYADDITKELSVIPGVSRVTLWGVQPQCVYVTISQARMAQLGLALADVQATLAQQNTVVNPGGIDLDDARLRFGVTGDFASPEEIGELVIRGRTISGGGDNRLVRIRDIATVERGYVEPSRAIMRQDGFASIGVAVSNAPGVNIVTLGQRIDRRLKELVADLPVGVEVKRISWQSDLVDSAVSDFMVSLGLAAAIVLGVLWVSMGLRSSIVVGLSGLLMVIIATFLVMKLIGEDLHRMSLGALIVAMGMMIDNALVVTENALVRIQQGADRVKAALEAATKPSLPLLGATVVGVMAFFPIAASEESAGEYTFALFTVGGVSLLISWLFAVTVGPIMCIALLPKPKADAKDPFASPFYRAFRGLLKVALRARYVVLLVFVVILGVCVVAFGSVRQMFFPEAARTQFMVDLWLPQGTRIERTSEVLAELEDLVMAMEGATGVSTFVGQGPPRFYLPVEPESPNSSYGQLIVNTDSMARVDELIPRIQSWSDENLAEGIVITRKYGLGPFESWPVDAKFTGPALADLDTLRAIGDQAEKIFRDSPHAKAVQLNWRERVAYVEADFDQSNARWTGLSRADVAAALRRSHDGSLVGLYREDDKLLPILIRSPAEERAQLAQNIDLVQVRSPLGEQSVPLSQVTRSVSPKWEDSTIYRFNRKRTIAVQGVPKGLATEYLADVQDRVDAIELPSGYSMFWDGEFRSSRDAQKSLIPGVVPAFIIMAVIVVALFNNYRQPLIILCIVPFALIGMVAGLLATGQPFGFVALLGAMSLAGMMVKNAIVLLDEISTLKRDGQLEYDAVVNASVARLRPVLLSAGTTVLGLIPLLWDVFWVSLAVVIMFGLAIGSVITMILVPVMYAIFYGVKPAKG